MEMEEQRWHVFSNGATLKLYQCWLLRSLDVPVVVVLELVVEMVSDLAMESVPDAHNAAAHDVRRDAVEFFNVPSPIAEPWNVDVVGVVGGRASVFFDHETLSVAGRETRTARRCRWCSIRGGDDREQEGEEDDREHRWVRVRVRDACHTKDDEKDTFFFFIFFL